MIRMGIELETRGLWPKDVLPALRAAGVSCELEHKNGARPYWTLTTDETFSSNQENCEVVSPIDPNFEELRTVIGVLKKIGCRVNKRCGLHVHVSDTDGPLRVRLPAVTIWSQREEFASKQKYTARDDHGNYLRDAAGNLIRKNGNGIEQREDNHLEVRVFNARLSYTYVLWAVNLVLRGLYRPKPEEALAAENEWDVVAI